MPQKKEINHTFRNTPQGGVFYGWFEAMHSRMDILIAQRDENSCMDIIKQIADETFRLEGKLNRFDTAGDVYALNTLSFYRMFHTDSELLAILDKAAYYKELTGGYFDICCNTPDYDPNEQYYTTDYRSEAVIVSREGVIFDFGGYAKGLALEKSTDILGNNGIGCALISFGGSSVYAMGKHPSGSNWQIGVENPFMRGVNIASFSLSNSALSSSGNSPTNMGHIVSPLHGKAIDSSMVISVSGSSALDCEILSTAMFAAEGNEEHCRNIINKCKDAHIVLQRAVRIDISSEYNVSEFI